MFNTKVDYGKYLNMGMNPAAVSDGAGWEALGKAMSAVADTMDEVGDANDLRKVEALRKDGATNLEGIETYSGKNQKLFDDVIKENKAKVAQGILSQVYSGQMPKQSFKDTLNVLDKGVMDTQTMQNINSYYDVQKDKQDSTNVLSMIQDGVKAKDIYIQAPDGGWSKGALSLITQALNKEDQQKFQKMMLENKQTFQSEENKKNRTNQKEISNISQAGQNGRLDKTIASNEKIAQMKANAKDTTAVKEDIKNIKAMEKKILDQSNPEKANNLTILKTQLNNGEISQNDYISKVADLSKEPLDKKVADKFDTRLNYLKALDGLIDQHRKGQLSRSTGWVNALTPNITDEAQVNESYLKQLLLGKTDQLSGTLSDKDMAILQATGLNENLSDEDFVKALIKTRTGIAGNIKNDYNDYLKSNDISTNITNGVKNIRTYDPMKKQWTGGDEKTQAAQKKSIVNTQVEKTVVQTGTTPDGKKVVKYSDGSIEYAD